MDTRRPISCGGPIRHGRIQPGEIGGRQLDLQSVQILFQMRLRLRAGNRDDLGAA
jgi:hypothetical protein